MSTSSAFSPLFSCIADVLAGLHGFVKRVEQDAADGGGARGRRRRGGRGRMTAPDDVARAGEIRALSNLPALGRLVSAPLVSRPRTVALPLPFHAL
jgi:hypothetical protein